jgi:glyoxylase I family protein
VGLDHLSFAVASHRELEAWQRQLQQSGVEDSPIAEARGGSAVLVFRDPDDIQLELIASPSPGQSPVSVGSAVKDH